MISFNNISGDCHAMNQKPLTYFRQVIACAANTKLMSSPDIPQDVKDKVNELLDGCGGRSVGSYSDSCGVEIVRKHVADYIKRRDNIDTDWRNIFLSTGASEGVKSVLSLLNHSRKKGLPVGVMIPIPQYPLYSATLSEYNMHQANYYLDETDEWSLKIEELERAYHQEKDKCDLKAIVIINPGNPTGSVLSRVNIKKILDFANQFKLMIIADEVYQQNVYDENSKFHSFKKVMHEETNYKLEIASMMSASKGFMGECGLRGGYCELSNVDEDVRALLYKGLSARLCSSVLGQFIMDCVVDPPKKGQPSYDLYTTERDSVLRDLQQKSKLVADTFNSVSGVHSNKVAGAMYAFPRLDLPKKAIQAAKEVGQAPDFFYCMNFLEQTGICVVPGSGFGQLPNTHHFRTTILPQRDVFEDMMDRFRKFHLGFIEMYE